MSAAIGKLTNDDIRRKTAFMDELKSLCEKHRCSLHVTDDGKPYGMAQPILTVEMDIIIEHESVVANFFSFDITGHINP